MATLLEKETKGAWIIHHGWKIALDVDAPAEFPVLDETAKAAETQSTSTRSSTPMVEPLIEQMLSGPSF